MTSRSTRKGRNGSQTQFPGKFHDMMTYVETNGLESAISWVMNGKGFMINDPDKLVTILPLFFDQTKYRSFRRQLNMWHFERILDGPHKGAFVHPYFVRGNRGLCAYMSRQFQPPKVEIMGYQQLTQKNLMDKKGAQPFGPQAGTIADNTQKHFGSLRPNTSGVPSMFINNAMIGNTEIDTKNFAGNFLHISQCSSPIIVEDLPTHLDLEPNIFSCNEETTIEGNDDTTFYMPETNSSSANSLLEPVADVLDSIFEEIDDEPLELLQWTSPCASTIAV